MFRGRRTRPAAEPSPGAPAKAPPRTSRALCQCGTWYVLDWADPKPCAACVEQGRKGTGLGEPSRVSDVGGGTFGRFYERSSQSRGWREIDGKRIYFINRSEADYYRYLSWLKTKGQIYDFTHQPPEFDFSRFGVRRGPSSFYKPDFKVVENGDGTKYHYVEVKGYLDQKSKTKLKRMAKYFPGDRVDLVMYRDLACLARQVGKLIPGWESETK